MGTLTGNGRRSTKTVKTLMRAGPAAAPAQADQPCKDGMPIEGRTSSPRPATATSRSIEADDGVWTVEASRDGRSVERARQRSDDRGCAGAGPLPPRNAPARCG